MQNYKVYLQYCSKNRLTRHSLIEKVGLDRKEYWGFFKINDSQFDSIVELGGVNRNIIY